MEYVSLEPLDSREFATADPRGFIARYRNGAVIDEVQRVPTLFSYLQEEIDRDPAPGRFVLTGSQLFELTEGITQSLAGRVALLQLLPLSLDEIRQFGGPASDDPWQTVWTGGYPRIYDRDLDAATWLSDYVTTYVQRDVRQVLNVSDLGAFSTFLRLVAARVGQEINLSSLGADAGMSHNTVRAWLSVLEASYIIFRIQPWHRNLRKRAVKTPKLHFVDSGLACQLLGIREPGQLLLHPLRGAVFESWVASEILKARLNSGQPADLFHLRQDRTAEVDLVVEAGRRAYGVEVKSGATIATEWLAPLTRFAMDVKETHEHLKPVVRLIHGGQRRETRAGVEILPWSDVQDVPWS